MVSDGGVHNEYWNDKENCNSFTTNTMQQLAK